MVRETAKRDRPRLWLASSQAVPSTPPAAKPSLDDTQLLEALRSGNPSAATSLHDRVRPQVTRTIGRLLGYDDADGEDLGQLAMIEMVTSIDRFRGDCSLDAWTSMVTARIVYKHIRRRQTERRIFDTIELGDVVARSPRDVGREVAARSLIGRIRVHLDAMDEARAWTFLLHEVWGYDLRDIAEITGVSAAAAQSRLTRGRRDLHDRIATDPELAGALEGTEALS